MSAVYREAISDDRLLDVTNHVHAWLFGGEGTHGTPEMSEPPQPDLADEKLQPAIRTPPNA
jgi:hypothetical protein